MEYTVTRVLFALLAGVALYHRVRAARGGDELDRRKEGWRLLVGIRLAGLALVLTGVWAFRGESPWGAAARWAAVGMFGFWVGWLCWMFVTLGRNLTDTVEVRRGARLVVAGPYRWVRHPMYTGLLGAGMSLAFLQGSWWLAGATALCFGLLAARTPIEERYLEERFGEPYREYARRVRRFLPGIS
jgi:protein-S-isoprenylcysteine O-methyltransferase Ste14